MVSTLTSSSEVLVLSIDTNTEVATLGSVHLSKLFGTPVYVVPHFTPALKRVYGGVYLKERGVWAYPAVYPFNKFVESDLELVFGKDALEWKSDAKEWAAKQAAVAELIERQYYNPEFQFVTKPYKHQVDAFVFGIHNMRAGLFLDCGLGKTKVTTDILRYARDYNGEGKALVMVPLVILYKWSEELTLHSGDQLKPVVIDGTPKKKRALLKEPGDVYICTYGTASSLADEIIDAIDYTATVVDESHNLQTHNSDKTKAAVYLARKAPRRIILSGTAALGDPRHLWGQLDFLAPFLHEPSYWKFCERYVQFQSGSRHRIVTGFKNLDILQRRMNLVGLRRQKSECLDLPERTFVNFSYTIGKDQRAMYNELVKASRAELATTLRMTEEATPATRLTKLCQILSGYYVQSNKNPQVCDGCAYLDHCVQNRIHPYTKDCQVEPIAPPSTIVRFEANPKLKALDELIELQLVDPTAKTIVWAHYLEELNLIEQMFEDRGIGTVRVDGGVNGSEVKARVDKFQSDPLCRVYLGQIAAGIGVDLTAANYTIYYSLDWDLGHYLQSLDRNHRIGQQRNVTVYVLSCPGSVEDAIYGALQNKEDIRIALTDSKPGTQSTYARLVTKPNTLG